jgi:arsenical pump membrane protein
VNLLALTGSSVVLIATLLAAAVGHHRVPAVVVAVPGAALLIGVGAVGAPAAGGAVRQIAPTVAFLVVVLLLAHLADREGLFGWAAALTAGRSGSSPPSLLARVVVLAAVVTAVLSLDATVVLLTPVVIAIAGHMRCRCGRTPTPPGTWPTPHRCFCRCRT